MNSGMFQNIGFCTDFSENADQAFVAAEELAARYGASLHIIHVMVPFSLTPPVHATYLPIEYDPGFVEEMTEAARKAIEERYVGKLPADRPREVHLLSGYPATEIVRIAEEKKLDLLVMGSHGLTGIAHVLFGSTADRIVRKAPCSGLTVRLAGHHS